MKQYVLLALLLVTTNAQMVERRNLYQYFGSCQGDEIGSKSQCELQFKFNAECCKFHVVGLEDMKGQFCISDEQRQGKYSGSYMDKDFTYWQWECYKPPPPPEPKPDPTDDKDKDEGEDKEKGTDKPKECVRLTEDQLPAWHPYNDEWSTWIETAIWMTYLSAEIYLIGLLMSIPLGIMLYSYLMAISIWNFFEMAAGSVDGNFGEWYNGPFHRAWISGPIIFSIHTMLAMIPGFNALTAYYVGYWANIDYFGDNYLPFAGPYMPTTCDKVFRTRYFYFI